MKLVGLFVGMVTLSLVLTYIWFLYKNPEYYGWPRVTRCRICGKTVYAWQRKERRPFHVVLDNPDDLLCNVSASGIVHLHCKGNPDFHVSVGRS